MVQQFQDMIFDGVIRNLSGRRVGIDDDAIQRQLHRREARVVHPAQLVEPGAMHHARVKSMSTRAAGWLGVANTVRVGSFAAVDVCVLVVGRGFAREEVDVEACVRSFTDIDTDGVLPVRSKGIHGKTCE